MLVKEWLCNLSKMFFESDLHLFQPLVQKGAHILQPSKEEAFALILNVLRKRVALGYSQLLSPTKMSKNPTKIWKL